MEIGVTSNKTPDVTDVTKIPSAPRVFEFFRVDLVWWLMIGIAPCLIKLR
jgi:hypothetical protein